LVLFPWEESSGGSFSVAGVIASVNAAVVRLRVSRCSHFPPGAELPLHARYIPEPMRRVGAEFSFTFPVERLALVVAGTGTDA
jgi:hypothetical protein